VSSDRGERAVRSFPTYSHWWWIVDCLFMVGGRTMSS
jgi:hypothetical protein